MFDFVSLINQFMPLIIIYVIVTQYMKDNKISMPNISMPKNKKDNIKIKELSDINFTYMRQECLLHGSHIAKKLFLRSGMDINIYIGKIKGWNKNNEVTMFYISRKFRHYIIITTKDIDTLHHDIVIDGDFLDNFNNSVLIVTEYNDEQNEYKKIYDYFIKRNLAIMNFEAIDGQYYNMSAVYRKELADQLNHNTINNMNKLDEEDYNKKYNREMQE